MSSIPTVDEHLINAPYYQGFQTRIEAETLIPERNGTFLVRLVEKPGELIYILSVYWNGEKHHFRIYEAKLGTKKKGFYIVTTEVPKKTIPELIRFHRYTQTPICNVNGVRLLKYVECNQYALYREQLDIKGQVGHGEFGEVHKGRLQLGIWRSVDVAIKQDTQQGIDPNDRIRFLREANLMMRLQHRNIVRLFGVVVHDDPILIVTEYAAGGCLLPRLMSDKPPTRVEKKRFCRDICYGMAYLESNMVMHRDLSAKNCLLDAAGTVKIADFGLSIWGKSRYVNKSARAPMRYIPPETLKRALFTPKTDVWAYGCVLFEIWKHPYEEPYQQIQNNFVLRKRILYEGLRLEPPEEMPHKLQEVMLHCHRTDPEERPTFAEVTEQYFGPEKRYFREDMSRCCNSFMRLLSI